MPSRRFVSQLNHNEQIDQTFLASNKQLRPNRQGNLYLQLDLSDRSGSVQARMWNASDSDFKAFENGDYVMVEGATQLFQGAMQLIAKSIHSVSPAEVDEADFLMLQSEDINKMRSRLVDILRGIKSAPLLALVNAYLEDDVFMDKFTRAPAAMKNHHAYQGGLLDHTVSMLELCLLIGSHYAQLDTEKLMVGAFLHDSAKIDELTYERDIAYSDAGQMLGHMILALGELDAKAKEAERRSQLAFSPVLLMEIKHMIISHHGEYAYGSAKLPMSLEAVALHYIDNIDAKMASFGQLISDCPNVDSHWTQYFPNIERKLWKGVKS